MKKIFCLLIISLYLITPSYAKKQKCDFENVIQDSGVDIESIAISIKNADNGKILYSLNDKMLMNPASVQKIRAS